MIAKDQIKSVTTALSTLIAAYPKAPVIVTGHSLGAATATLILAYLFDTPEVQLPMDRLFIYTYGQPRVGGSDFAAWYNGKCGGRHFRLVHYNDVVPHIPCCERYLWSEKCRDIGDKFDPWHVMTEIYYKDTGMTSLRNCQGKPLGEDPSCAYGLPFYDFSVKNHLTYFDAQVGYMCDIMHGKNPPKATEERHRRSFGAIICVY